MRAGDPPRADGVFPSHRSQPPRGSRHLPRPRLTLPEGCPEPPPGRGASVGESLLIICLKNPILSLGAKRIYGMTAYFIAFPVTFSPALGAPECRAVVAAQAGEPSGRSLPIGERSLPDGSPQVGPADAEGRGRRCSHGRKCIIHGGQSRRVTQPVLSAGAAEVSSGERVRAHRC